MSRSKTISIWLLLSFSLLGTSQVVDNFDDGDFSDGSPLTWVASQTSGGDDFVITSGEVQSNGPSASGDIYLTTNLGIDFNNNDVVWTFRARYTTASPASGNRIEIYLISDVEDITGSPTGYYIGMGETGSTDGIDLFKTGSSTAIINDDNDLVGSGINTHVRVTRTSDGMWTLEADASGGDTFSEIGTANDTEFTSGDFFGFYVIHSSTRNQDYFFDDFSVTATPIPDTSSPTIQSVTPISDSQVDVQFSEPVDETTSEVIGNYEIDGGISVINASRDVSNNSIVHLTVDQLTNGATYTLTINNVEDENGNMIGTNSQESFEYLVFEEAELLDVVINEYMAAPNDESGLPSEEYVEIFNRSDKFIDLENWTISDASGSSSGFQSTTLRPGQYLILTATGNGSLFSGYGEVLEVSSFPALNNSGDNIIITNASATIIHQLSFEDTEDGVSTELINPNDPCLSIESYALSADPSGGTPGTQNSVFDDTPDTTKPTILSYSFDTGVIINFSEVMDVASLSSGDYEITGGLTVNQISVEGEFPTSVEITFNESIEAGKQYELTLSNVADCSGNLIEEITFSFGLGRSPAFNELIITEIMFDPDPQLELPNREFIEVYNATEDIISIEGVELTDASSTVDLPSMMIGPGMYYVLTSTSAASEFVGNVIGVPSFPSLNNSGEQLILSRNEGLIFSVNYDPEWHDEDKSEGGVTLEMKDVSNPCKEEDNWGSSGDPDGGTPGRANSIAESFPDNFSPEIIRVLALAGDSVRIDFNEKLTPSNQIGVDVQLSPSVTVEEIIFNFLYPQALFIKLSSQLTENVLYTLTISDVGDCSGNTSDDLSAVFALPVQAEEEEIKLSEVLFNPRPNGVDFVEIYNDSDKYISLKGWQIARLDGEEIDADVIFEEELVLTPNQYLVLTTDKDILLTNYPKAQTENLLEIASMPAYNDDEGTILILDSNDDVKDEFFYKEEYHFNLLESVDGVSLERVSFSQPNNADNWRSASSTEGYATPGYLNSQSFRSDVPKGRVTASPEVFIPGNVGSGRDFTTINYEFNEPGKFANVNIYDQVGRLVKNLAQGALLSTKGFLRWDGDTNDGKMARMGYYLIIFEIYDSNGNSETIKETVVVGRDF